MKIEIGKEYIYNNELDKDANGIGDRCLRSFDNNRCIVIEDNDSGVPIVSFNGFNFRVYKSSLTPIPEIVPPQGGTGEVDPNKCETCDHNIHDCIVCPVINDDAKYKRAWEIVIDRLRGKFHPRTVVAIAKIMGEVLEDEK